MNKHLTPIFVQGFFNPHNSNFCFSHGRYLQEILCYKRSLVNLDTIKVEILSCLNNAILIQQIPPWMKVSLVGQSISQLSCLTNYLKEICVYVLNAYIKGCPINTKFGWNLVLQRTHSGYGNSYEIQEFILKLICDCFNIL